MVFEKKRGANTSAPTGRNAGLLPNCSHFILPLLAVVLLALTAASCTAPESASEPGSSAATQASDTLSLAALADSLTPAEAARYAFHGRDGRGKDGPMARVGYDLAHLYFAHRAHQREAPGEAFQPPMQARVSEGRVLVDATARADADRLRADLDALGLEGGATAGPVVSGRLPIEALPEAAGLESLRSMRPARPATLR